MAVSTRQALLQALSAAGGSYVSGQQLAETLGVSRAAVHKAAAALTAQGYALEAAPRRGYRLAGGDPFCAEAIGDYPAPIYLYDTLESSNRTAKLLALDGAPHGTLVLTAHQSAGRGRLGRRFESPAGKGVYCSVLLRPEMPAANAQTATISAAVAVFTPSRMSFTKRSRSGPGNINSALGKSLVSNAVLTLMQCSRSSLCSIVLCFSYSHHNSPNSMSFRR